MPTDQEMGGGVVGEFETIEERFGLGGFNDAEWAFRSSTDTELAPGEEVDTLGNAIVRLTELRYEVENLTRDLERAQEKARQASA